MAQSAGTPINCPNCRQPFSAILEQVIDIDSNPQAKVRLLNVQLNHLTCPLCGFQFTAHTPLIYHDGSQELLITYVPMELNLPQAEQERIIGQLQQALINSLPPEQRKGYMFTPRSALTMQSLADQVLEADGFTPEMREAHKARLDLIDMLLETPEDQRITAIQSHDDQIDDAFLQTLAAAAQLMQQRGDDQKSTAMAALYDDLIANTTIGRQLATDAQRQGEAVEWAREKLQNLGEMTTHEQLVALVLEASEDDDRLQAVIAMAWPAMDYQFFQAFTEHLETSEGAERERLETLRAEITELTTALEQQNRAILQQAANVLRNIMSAQNIDETLRQHEPFIDDAFMAVLNANIQAAEQAKDLQASARLKQVYERVVAMLQSQAPPEVRFINALMMTDDDASAQAIIDQQAGQLNAEVLELIDVLIDDLREGGHDAPADRLTGLREKVAAVVNA
jgi:hypothetical protein